MPGLKNLGTRLMYNGGYRQEDRMRMDKLRTLHKALLYSYQAETIEYGGQQYRCLINPSKNIMDYDNKEISIPFESIMPTAEEIREPNNELPKIFLPGGTVFRWIETNTYWIIYLQSLEESAYYRADIKRCDYELMINDTAYRVYVRGPVETTIPENQKLQTTWNDMNYTLNVVIQKNSETQEFFHRFQKVRFLDKMWEVQSVDRIGGDGVLEVTLKEYFNNEIGDSFEEDVLAAAPEIVKPTPAEPAILGDFFIKPYSKHDYTVQNINGGVWEIVEPELAEIRESDDTHVKVKIKSGRSCKVHLNYITPLSGTLSQTLYVESL